MGISRGNEKNIFKTLISGFVAGMFIALAGIGQITASQTLSQTFDIGFSKFIGASIFPIGLMLCVFTGASLFTGNSLLTLSFLTKDLKFSNLVKNLTIVWIGNFLGSIFTTKDLKFSNLVKNLTIVWIGNFLGSIFTAYVAFYAGIFKSPIIQKVILDTGLSKISLSFSECVASGFFCNILVTMGIIMAMCSTDATGKFLGCWFPVMLFVLCGYQHVVANMFIIYAGKILSPVIMAMCSTDATGKFLGCWFPVMLFVLCGYQHVVANMFIIYAGKILSPENFSMLDIFIKHFLPTSIGNFLSGGVFLPLFLYFSYYKK